MLTVLIANPVSGFGRGGKLLPHARRAFEGVGAGRTVVRVTERAGDEGRLVAEAFEHGADTIAVLGGDGTWSKVACAMLALGGDARLALLAAGTGNDLAKSVGAPARDFAATARLAAAGSERRIDVGRVNDLTFVNICGFGFDAAVLEEMRRLPWLTGSALYAVAAARQLFAYRGFGARLLDGPSDPGGHANGGGTWLGIFAANGRMFGGAFPIAPHAECDDGALDVITLAQMSPLRRVRTFAAALRGAHLGAPEVAARRMTSGRWLFDAPPLIDVDGDLYRADRAEVEIECIPSALRLVASR